MHIPSTKLEQTNGLGAGCLWLSFHDIRSADYVLNRIGEALGAEDIPTWTTQQKVEALGRVLHDNPLVLVWDNFESASGNEAAGIDPLLPAEDRQPLADLLRRFRGGKTKVLITSRSDENWLAPELRRRIELGGLYGEERWEFCTAVVQGLGVNVDREGQDLQKLMETLGGHPLLMRAVLPRLESEPPAAVLGAIQKHIDRGDPRTTATLRFVEEKLPDELRPLLVPLALHERFADADYIEYMAKAAGEHAPDRATIDRLFDALAAAGLVRHRVQSIYELHPALSSYLRTGALTDADAEAQETWSRAFVDVMGQLADALAPRPLHEQRVPFHLHEANFHHALGLAERLEMSKPVGALTQSLAAYAQNTRNFEGAERFFQRLAGHCVAQKDKEGEAAAYHQVGMIVEERRDFDGAEQWHRKSLEIKEKLGDEHGAARTYHQLGRIAEARGDFGRAEQWYQNALATFEKLGIEHHAAATYVHLGIIAGLREQFEQSGRWLIKSLQAFRNCQDEARAAQNTRNFFVLLRQAPAAEQQKLRTMWEQAGLGPLPEDDDG